MSERQTSVALRYLTVAVATPLAAAIAFAYGLHLSAEKGPTARASNNTTYIYHLERRQREIFERLDGRRIMLVGGSGVLFSLDAREIERRAKLPVVNFGLHWYLGIDYLLTHAQRSLRRGDIVVPFFEYGVYEDAAPTRQLADYVVPYDAQYLRETSWWNGVRLATQLDFADYGSKMSAGWFDAPASGARFATWLDERGDLTVNRRSAQMPYHRAILARQTPIDIRPVDPANRERIARFAQWCRDEGVTLIAGFPAFLDFADYAKPEYQTYFATIADVYASQRVPVLGEPREFFFPQDAFLDTAYHLHDESRPQMSALVGDRLAALLRGAQAASR